VTLFACAPAWAQAAARPSTSEGQPGRQVLGGKWYFRADDLNVGIEDRFMDQRTLNHWLPITLPYDFNAAEKVTDRSSVGWFRRDITLTKVDPDVHRIVRFEGAGHFTTVYLNGRQLTKHAGNYLPFEADLQGLKKGVNRLVVRVSSMRARTDLSHWRPASYNGFGNGGWWNFGGIHREVTVRRAKGVDIQNVQAMPRLACPACSAKVTVKATLRNLEDHKVRTKISLNVAGRRIRVTPRFLAAGATREITTQFTIARPRLWDIRRGNLYALSMQAQVPGIPAPAPKPTKKNRHPKPPPAPKPLNAGYETSFGVRDLRKGPGGVVYLNGRQIHLRGVSIHEDDPVLGSAWKAPQRSAFLNRVDQLGATIVRAHYPLSPALLEALDRRGVLVWDEAPVYQVQNDRWALPSVRRNAVNLNAEMVMRDRGHPSVIAYSMANELPDPVTGPQASFIRTAAATIRKLDPTRLVAIDRVARVGAETDANPIWRTVDALGVNEYFGWYRGAFPPLPETTSADLGTYLDTLHSQQPNAALFVTEFGAETNRDGPESEKGTNAFQIKFLRDHLAIDDSKPYLNGAIIWALRDFRVIPGWAGGNPVPDPPYNHKGLLDVNGNPKPAYWAVQQLFKAHLNGR
jgi:beta-glucuronidase